MLVLHRRLNEAIIIECGDTQIEIVLTDVYGMSAKIGIEADHHVNIIRKELLQSTKQERCNQSQPNQWG